jgi:hypothetical protein
MLSLAKKSFEDRKEAQNMINSCREFCGKLIIAEIIHSVVQTSSTKKVMNEIKTRLEHNKHIPLHEFQQNGKTFQMQIKFMRQAVVGEYMSIADFDLKYGISEELEKILDMANMFVIENVQHLFGGLKKREKTNYAHLATITHSLKTKGIYYYENFGDKSFGIIFVEVV